MDKKIDDGGSAFPKVKTEYFGRDPDVKTYGGMSLRDWFAGQSLAGMFNHIGWVNTYDDDQAEVGRRAYQIADAMLAARSSKT